MGNIGVLGVDKDGEEWYQVTIGGTQGSNASLGKVIGPSFRADEMPGVIERIVETFQEVRVLDEPFSATLARVGVDPFKASVYREAA